MLNWKGNRGQLGVSPHRRCTCIPYYLSKTRLLRGCNVNCDGGWNKRSSGPTDALLCCLLLTNRVLAAADAVGCALFYQNSLERSKTRRKKQKRGTTKATSTTTATPDISPPTPRNPFSLPRQKKEGEEEEKKRNESKEGKTNQVWRLK